MSLIVFPAIDLKGGQVVRLAEGDMDRATIYGDDPAAQADLFAQAGMNAEECQKVLRSNAVECYGLERFGVKA